MTNRQSPPSPSYDRATEPSRPARFKQRLADGDVLLGAWMTIPELSVAEMMASVGYDYVIIDAEHSPWTLLEIQTALAGFTGSPTTLLVRIPSLDPVYVKHVLDLGIDGLICPLVQTADQARSLVAACLYPPDGARGYGPRRAARYGLDADSYTARANSDVIVIPQIEDARYVHEAEDIMDVDGVDAICVGPTDLSGSMGLLRQLDHPEVTSILNSVMASAQSRGLAVCTGVVLAPEVQADWVARGARLALIASDADLIVKSSRALIDDVRSRLGL